MEFTESVINQFLADFILPFTRISALVMAMIGLGSQTIPTRVKLFLCLAITLAAGLLSASAELVQEVRDYQRDLNNRKNTVVSLGKKKTLLSIGNLI